MSGNIHFDGQPLSSLICADVASGLLKQTDIENIDGFLHDHLQDLPEYSELNCDLTFGGAKKEYVLSFNFGAYMFKIFYLRNNKVIKTETGNFSIQNS